MDLPNPIKQRELVFIFGKTGTGKSFFANRFLWNYSRVIILDPMDEYEGVYFDNLETMQKFVNYTPHLFRVKTDRMDLADELFLYCFEKGDCVLAVDEAQRLLPSGATQLSEPILDAIYRGRHRGLSLVFIAQRPSTVNIHVRSQWTRLITFRQTEPSDIQYFIHQTGEPLAIQELQQFHYYDISPFEISLKSPIKPL